MECISLLVIGSAENYCSKGYGLYLFKKKVPSAIFIGDFFKILFLINYQASAFQVYPAHNPREWDSNAHTPRRVGNANARGT